MSKNFPIAFLTNIESVVSKNLVNYQGRAITINHEWQRYSQKINGNHLHRYFRYVRNMHNIVIIIKTD